VKPRHDRPTLTMNIKRQYFAEIVALPKRKHTEYREMSKHWLVRLGHVGPAPFDLRLLNGMLPPVPEATVRVTSVTKRLKTKELELHLGAVLSVKHWDRKRERPR